MAVCFMGSFALEAFNIFLDHFPLCEQRLGDMGPASPSSLLMHTLPCSPFQFLKVTMELISLGAICHGALVFYT